MPITLSISLSRKVSKDYQSKGYSVSLNAELPADAGEQNITESADRLFGLCDQLLDHQIQEDTKDTQPNERRRVPSRNGNGYRGNGRSNGKSGGVRALTSAQERAINAMARKLDGQADDFAQHEFGSVVGDLNIRQASELIDVLKSQLDEQQVSR